jgi:hypothetical protein
MGLSPGGFGRYEEGGTVTLLTMMMMMMYDDTFRAQSLITPPFLDRRWGLCPGHCTRVMGLDPGGFGRSEEGGTVTLEGGRLTVHAFAAIDGLHDLSAKVIHSAGGMDDDGDDDDDDDDDG